MLRLIVSRLLFLVALLLALPSPARAQGDDIAAASRSVVRVVVVRIEGEEIVDFGHGSGFAVSRNRIVTNAHVVALAVQDPGSVAIGIVPSEGSESYGARVIAVDAARDLALLEMQEGSVPPISLFTGRLDPGQAVAALGYPGNVDLATARSMQDYIRPMPPTRSTGNFSNTRQGDSGLALVHTADIARGNSGGPLVDACGRVIGVNRLITRNDMGDSTFGFAIPASAVAAFLRRARQDFQDVDVECVSLADRQREEQERAERERQLREADEAARTRTAAERREQALQAIEEQRDLRLGIAVLLLVLSLAAMGTTGILVIKDRPKPAIYAGIGAGLLLIGAAAAFLTRPSYATASEDAAAEVAQGDPNRFVGDNLCTLDRERSRVTVSTEEEVPLDWAEGGCVNGSTQYAQDGSVWRRVLVPNGEQTVSITEFDPATGELVVNRYFLGAQAMTEARRLRRRVEQRSCTSDGEALAILGDRQRDLTEALPDQPNERLVYRCAPEAAGSD